MRHSQRVEAVVPAPGGGHVFFAHQHGVGRVAHGEHSLGKVAVVPIETVVFKERILNNALSCQKVLGKTRKIRIAKPACALTRGAVGVKINGKKELLALDIKPEIVDPDDIETLSDVLCAAFNEAIRTVEDTNQKAMSSVTGSLNMPGLF